MPTYEYKCDGCGAEFERFQSMTAAPVRVCPECKKAKVKRLISCGAGLIFKGSGFYITDYRSDGYKKAAQSDSGGTSAASGGGGDGGGKKEGKTDAKTTAKSDGKATGKSGEK